MLTPVIYLGLYQPVQMKGALSGEGSLDLHALVQREMTPPSIPVATNCICTSFQQSFHRIHRYEGHEGKDWRMQGNEYV